MELDELERQVRRALEERLGRPITDAEWEALKLAHAESLAAEAAPLPQPRGNRLGRFARATGWFLLASLIWGAFLGLWALGPLLIGMALGVGPGEEGPIDWSGMIWLAWFVFLVPVYWISQALRSRPWTESEFKVIGWAVGFAIASPAAGGAGMLIINGSRVEIALGILVALAGAVVSIFVGMAIAMTEQHRALTQAIRRY